MDVVSAGVDGVAYSHVTVVADPDPVPAAELWYVENDDVPGPGDVS